MDFRNCPACKASVLDDDAQDCPFCGASMSGKPQAAAKKAPAPAPKAAAVAEKPPEKKEPAGKTGPARRPERRTPPPEPTSEDPFEVDTSAIRRAIKLAPRPTKSRTHEVVCPMCETAGYLNPDDAGKDVQCANPECMVPVFKSARIVAEEAPPEESKLKKQLIMGGAATGVIVLGTAVWFLFLREPPTTGPLDVGPTTFSQGEDEPAGPQLIPDSGNTVVQRTVEKPLTVPEIQKRVLGNIIDKAGSRERNRNPEFGTQLAAEAFAQAGELTKAREQIRRLQTTARTTPYFQIQPLVELGWQQIARGETDQANESATAAVTHSQRMPKSIRKTHDAAISLGALLAALDRTAEMNTLIEQHQDFLPRGQVSTLWRAALDSRTFDLDREVRLPYHRGMPEPMRLGIVESLVAHGQQQKGLAVAMAAPTAVSQDACRAAWAGRLLLTRPNEALATITQHLEPGNVSPAGQARVWSAVAAHRREAEDEAGAQAALANAVAAFEKIPVKPPVAIPDMKPLYDSEGKRFAGLPNPSPAHAAALAAADIAQLQLQSGETELAWSTYLKGLEHARGMAPSPSATKGLFDTIQRQDASTRQQLNTVLNLRNDETRMRTAYIRYRKQAGLLDQEAQARFAIQTEILRQAAEGGLLHPVWDTIVERSRAENLGEREPYLDSPVAGIVIGLSTAADDSELARKIAPITRAKPISIDPVDELFATARKRIDAGNIREASEMIKERYRSNVAKEQPDRLDQAVFRLLARVQQQQSLEKTLDFIRNLHDPVIKEDSYLLLAGASIKNGTAPKLWTTTVDSRDLGAIDFVSMYRGFIAGIPRSPARTAVRQSQANGT